jgi:A/G-specific adenine glycosylase
VPPAAWRTRLRRAILAWYATTARELPWRGTRDPYRIWVSEVMLQQTQVETVRPYYARFLARFPTFADLAAAPEPAVLAAWQGLGYYRRARAMHAAAKAIVERHHGRFPDRVAEAEALPGIGRYTAGAVLSIAYGEPLPAVDANVGRVLLRLLGEEGARGSAAVEARLWETAAALVPRSDPGTWTQAVMELGALLCTPRAPRCDDCPVADLCRAHATGRVAMIPKPRPRRVPPTVQVAAAVLRAGGGKTASVGLVERPPESGTLVGFFELPAVDVAPETDPRAALARRLQELGGEAVEIGAVLARVEHGMFNRRALVTAYAAAARFGTASSIRILPTGELREHPLTTQSRKILREIAGDDEEAPATRRQRVVPL